MKKVKGLEKSFHIILLLIILLSIAYILYDHVEHMNKIFVFDNGNVFEWNDSWDINYGGKIEEGVTLPIEIPAEPGSIVMLRKMLPDKIKEYNCLMIESIRQDVWVSIGGIQREIYSDETYRSWGKTSPSGIVFVPLYNTDSLNDIVIQIKSDSEFSGNINGVYLGDEKSLLLMVMKANMLWLLLTTIVFILGVICLICFLIYSNHFEISRAMHYLALFALLSSVWGFSKSGVRQLFVTDITGHEALGYSAYMLIPNFMFLYVNKVFDNKYLSIVKPYAAIVVSNFIVESILQDIFGIGFFEMRYASQAIFFLGILIVLVLCILEMKKGFDLRVRSVAIGAIGLLIGELSEVTFWKYRFRGEAYNRYIGGAFIFLCYGFLYTLVCVRKEQQLKKDAENANRAKSLFLATMSHEIKTPINVVLGMNEMILRDSTDNVVREYAANINAAGKTLISLVNDILDFSKIESGKMDIVCVEYRMKSLLRDLIMMTEERISEKELKLILDIDETIPSVYYGDEIRVKQVVTNLLTNAAKYTPKGSITFTVKKLSEDGDEIELYFSVKDTGIGIHDEDIKRFMDSFVRVDQVRNSNIEGTGLGLSISKQILELMGSKLEVSSVYGEGSNFHFAIKQRIVDKSPIGSILVKEAGNDKVKKITVEAPEARVLAVDDNRVNLAVISGLLKPTKMKVDICDSGMKCLEFCRDNCYDLIFMDHMMPEMDGIETLKRLREDTSLKSSHSVVIALTANTVSGAEEMYKESGFDYYLKKPIDMNELNEVLIKYAPKDKIIIVDE